MANTMNETVNKAADIPQRKSVSNIFVALFKVIGLAIKDFFRGITSPKYWIRIILLVLLSTVINLIRSGGTGIEFIDGITSSDIGTKVLGVLSFLLYSGGGVSKNAGEIFTGTLAKTLCATLIVNILSGKMRGTWKGLKLTPGSLLGKHMRPSKALTGIGAAFFVYAALSGQSGYAGIMVAVSMLAGVLRALGGNGQILRTLAASVNSYKVNKIRRTNLTNMNAMLAGGVIGCILSYGVNSILGQVGCIIAGAVLMAAGFLLGIPAYAKCKAEVLP